MSETMQRHVAFLVPHLGGGGAEMNTLRLANALAARGLRVTMLVVRGGGAFEPQLAAQVARVRVGSTDRPRSSTTALLASVPRLRRWLRGQRPDFFIPVMDISALAGLLACFGLHDRPRLIVNIQNNPDAKLRGGMAMRLATKAALALYPRSDLLVPLSEGVAQALQRLLPQMRGRMRIIPNIGVTGAIHRNAQEQVPEQPARKHLLVAVGRLVEQKGYPFLLEAMQQLAAQQHDAELWILGGGVLEATLKRRAAELGVSERVHFLGFKPNPHAYMARADVFVLPSLWEGFGNVIAEAMTLGVPVVATDCPHGPAEILEGGASGLLVPPGDPAALAAAIARLLADPALRKQVGEAGRLRAEHYRDDVVAAQWQALFASFSGSRN